MIEVDEDCARNRHARSFLPSLERSSQLFLDPTFRTKPWLGTDYLKQPKKIALLFESSHTKDSPSDHAKMEWTIGLVSRHRDNIKRVAFLTKVEKLLTRLHMRMPDIFPRESGFDTICYYNVVEDFMRETREAPKADAVSRSLPSLRSFLSRAEPALVLSFGRYKLRRWIYKLASEDRVEHLRREARMQFVPFKLGNSWVLNASHPMGTFSYDGTVEDIEAQIDGTDLREAHK